jgi:hypothetical protein
VVLFPPLLLVTYPVAIAAGAGAWIGHLAHGATGASLSHVTKHLEGSDFDEAEREAMAAAAEQTA